MKRNNGNQSEVHKTLNVNNSVEKTKFKPLFVFLVYPVALLFTFLTNFELNKIDKNGEGVN